MSDPFKVRNFLVCFVLWSLLNVYCRCNKPSSWDKMFSFQKMALTLTVLVFAGFFSFVSPDAQGDAYLSSLSERSWSNWDSFCVFPFQEMRYLRWGCPYAHWIISLVTGTRIKWILALGPKSFVMTKTSSLLCKLEP